MSKSLIVVIAAALAFLTVATAKLIAAPTVGASPSLCRTTQLPPPCTP